jgi:signal transduction histidine kinase
MTIRQKIILYFSITVIGLTGLSLTFIYTLFAEFREEEFQQRQKEKIISTLKLLQEIEQMNERLALAMDKITIHDFYDEKMLLYNADKELIFSSLDDLPIEIAAQLLKTLSAATPWIETQEEGYDVVGMYIQQEGTAYYGISKAYDSFGYANLYFLRNVLLLTFLGISLIVILLTFYLSHKISAPIAEIASRINAYSFDEANTPIQINRGHKEIRLLTERFNELMKKTNEAFAFQKHAIHHISHELKTPIAVLVSNFERIEAEKDPEVVKSLLKHQKEDTKSLSEIINALLEISKAESGHAFSTREIRADELLFDLAQELNGLYPDFNFSIDYAPMTEDEGRLTVRANERLLKSALMNLMLNCIQYSSDQRASILIAAEADAVTITLSNRGQSLDAQEQQYLFQHFFRGKNSQGKRGFGLGLVFVHKILTLHQGTIAYSAPNDSTNIFTLSLPLS